MNVWAVVFLYLCFAAVVVWLNYRFWSQDDKQTPYHPRPAPQHTNPYTTDPSFMMDCFVPHEVAQMLLPEQYGGDYIPDLDDAVGTPLDERVRYAGTP